MKISLKWLSEYIDIQEFWEKPETLGQLLTSKGFEVESIENKAKQYDNVVLGHILKKEQHPDADRLTVCQVSTGGGVVHQIVCGAKNHKAGDRVVVSLPGAVLPGNFEIKKSKIRGVESAGMLCSEVELGIAKESEGIMILPEDAPIGETFAQYYGMDDIVFELKVTPNRADGLSHVGLAREIGALLDRLVRVPKISFQAEGDTQSVVKVELREADECPRYAGRAIRGVRIGPSPAWLKQRLEAVGMSSINNVVDVTNFVMLELGQPLHAFDLRSIKGAKLVIAKSQPGEAFKSLDGTEFKLDGFELMIRDAERNVALAGVVGGQNSGVESDTQDIFVECAYFSAATVRRAARRHGIQTESAYRFSRGVDFANTPQALDRCCDLIVQVAGGKVLGNAYDLYPKPLVRKPIAIRIQDVSARLGYAVSAQDFGQWMRRLGCEVQVQGEVFQVTPPSFRHDLEIKEDLVEEYGRLNGYDAIPEVLPASTVAPTPHASAYTLSRMVGRRVQAEGYQQALNFSFVSEKFENQILGDRQKWKAVGLEVASQSVGLKNPLSEDLNVMRVSLLPGLLANVSYNQRYGVESGRFFEIGPTFGRSESGYVEESRLSLVAWGRPVDLWASKEPSNLVLELKTAMENLLRGMGGRNWSWESKTGLPDLLHPGQSATLFYEGKVVGMLGALHPVLLEELKLRQPVALAEFDLSLLVSGQPRAIKVKTPAKFPLVERDLAFLMPEDLPVQEVLSLIRKAAGAQLLSAKVFDVYQGDKLPVGQRSVAIRMQFQNPQSTLTDEQLTAMQAKIIEEAQKKLSISVRAN